MYFSDIILKNSESMPENPVFDLTFVQNTGAAFSILQDSRTFLIIFSALAAAGIAFYLIKHIAKVSTFSIFWVSMLI